MVLHNNAKMTLTFPALFQDSYDEKLHKQASFPSPLARGLQAVGLSTFVDNLQTNTIYDFFSVGYFIDDGERDGERGMKSTVWRRV